MGKIIVFGACGNVGQYLIDYLLSKREKEDVIAVDIFLSEEVKKLGVEFVELNINNDEDYSKLPQENIDVVIDLVGPMPARMVGYNPEEYVQTNILGTFKIAQYCVKAQVGKLIYARSFCDIRARAEKELVLKVDMEPYFDYGNQHAVYSVSQISAYHLMKCIHAYDGLDVIAFRLPTVYLWSKNDVYGVNGVMQKKMYREIIDNAIEGKNLEIWGDPARQKDMLYVKDMCRLLYMAAISDVRSGLYNAGTGIGTSLEEQVLGIKAVFDEDNKSSVVFRPDKPNAPQYIMDITETTRDFGYVPKYSYIEMLKDMKKERLLDRF